MPMQTENEDRRASHVRRVELETLVEICGRDEGVPPFEAESVEISGRGMQVRTRFLPDLHTPLVLRFEHDGHEVLVEGEVAWRKGDDQGGQFGIKFTALDSKSVAALKALSVQAAARETQDEDAEGSAHVLSERGAPVKLHIQGLGAPMKARVFRGTARKLEVGSQLEFLKVGKSLELEDVSAGNRRSAHIDGVTVAIDAQSQIPQLVVSLRYEGVEDDTPAPTILGSRKDKKRAAARAAREDEGDFSDSEDAEDSDDESEEDEYTEDIFKGKVGALAASAGRAVKNGSVQVATWSTQAVGGFGDLFRSVSARVASSKPRATTPRRTSRPPQGVGARQQARRGEALRPQQSPRRPNEDARSVRNIKPWLYGGALAACIWGTYSWLGHAADQDSAYALHDGVAPAAPAGVDPERGAARGPRPESGLPAASDAVAASADGPAQRFPKGAALSAEQQLQANNRGIVAQVPLFGPTEMATNEGAPINPPPRSEVVDEYSLSKDQVFGDDRVQAAPRQMPDIPGMGQAAQAAKPPAAMALSEQTPPKSAAATVEAEAGSESFQVGRMHLPVVYRLRLDGAATALQGNKLATGFSVLLPGRKVMESGAAIEGRDDRIIDVHVQNTPAGGKVTFRFRKDIPGYKARVRKDYVEFFINSPEKKR
jgi:PilZ domain